MVGTVLLDTNVFSSKRVLGSLPSALYNRHIIGCRISARRLGHALHQKEHVGDLWIAATAIR